MHPGFVLGVLIAELSLSGEHEINKKNANEIEKDDLDDFPGLANSLDPLHGAKIAELFHK
jgi:hypothetical protein